ncbi:hypothetical protein [uncultured Jannaschia sp.]|uniref:hypothetical protein n=1 Tax=uncultured Jannaschia sp. TaxID=293347 RepID=UPI00261A97EB|nr:hypothetical protein [uncultured Jannaschia sp.]
MAFATIYICYISSPLEAAVLTVENKSLLCEKVGDASYVKAETFYSFILAEARIPQALVSNRDTGLEKAVLDPNFPPNDVAPRSEFILRKMRESKLGIIQQAAGDLAVTASVRNHYKEVSAENLPAEFHIQRSDSVVPISILCLAVPAQATLSQPNKLASRFVLRKNIEDLASATARPSDETPGERAETLKTASLATLSFVSDNENDATSVALEAAVGYRIGRYTPFLKFEFLNVEADAEDKAIVSPGLLYDNLSYDVFSWASIRTLLQAYGVFDIENDAERVALRASIEPGFTLGSNLSFGAYSAPFGGLVWIRPSVIAFAEASHTTDSGENLEFSDRGDFLGLGGRIGLDARLPEVNFAKGIFFRSEYSFIQPVSKSDDPLEYFETSITWTPEDARHFGISLGYKHGENKLTFQDEELLTLSFGARF